MASVYTVHTSEGHAECQQVLTWDPPCTGPSGDSVCSTQSDRGRAGRDRRRASLLTVVLLLASRVVSRIAGVRSKKEKPGRVVRPPAVCRRVRERAAKTLFSQLDGLVGPFA